MLGFAETGPPDAEVPMANRNDTIVLDSPLLPPTPRLKRVKTEHSGAESPSCYYPSQHVLDVLHAPSPVLPTTPQPVTPRSGHGKSHERELSPFAPYIESEKRHEGPVLRKNKTPSLRLRLSQQSATEKQSPRAAPALKARTINFYAAPTDPSEFIWWITQQVTQAPPTGIATNGTNSSLPAFDSMTSVMRPMNMQPHGFDDDPDIAKEKEREKQRVDNRERKKRWRETNAERNKDNDLRCRVTKLAKAKFGAWDSEAKTAFIEREFEARRAKRAEKERRHASYQGTLAAFRTGSNTSKDLKEVLHQSLKGSHKPNVELAGSQLIEILVEAAAQQVSDGVLRVAQNLREDLASGALDLGAMEEATRILSSNEELRRVLESGFVEGKESAEPESVSDEDEEHAHGNGHVTKDTTPANTSDGAEEHVKATDPVGNLNLAMETLNGMSDTKVVNSNKPGQRGRPPKTGVRKGRGKRKRGDRAGAGKSSAPGEGLDTSSIDALLALANGGSIMHNDDDDDETVPDADELVADDLNFFDATADGALNSILEKVATRIVRERLEHEGFKRRNGSSLAFDGDAFRTHAIREQVLKLKTFLSEAGVSVNTLMPLAQAQALSELYAHLLKYIERESTPPNEAFSIPPGPHSADSKQFTRSQGILPASASSSSQLPGGTTDVPNTSTETISSSSHRSADEQSKITAYGFPLLPGGSYRAR